MGRKSEKKVKSDRINALRKQYDAFLEEDKKRKERNDYILGRLDKMRCSTTSALQLRPKIYYGEPSIYNRLDYRPEKLINHDAMMPVMPRFSHQLVRPKYEHNVSFDTQINKDDTSMLKELSKKYILIPKLRTMYPNEYVEITPQEKTPYISTVTSEKLKSPDTDDWKSKYSILEELKKKEKDDEIKECMNKQDAILADRETNPKMRLDISPSPEGYVQNYNYDDTPAKHEEEIPEKQLAENNLFQGNALHVDKYSEGSENTVLQENIAHADNMPIFSQEPSNMKMQSDNAVKCNSAVPNTQEIENTVTKGPSEQNILNKDYNIQDMPNEQYSIENVTNIQTNEEYPDNTDYQDYPVEYEQQILKEEIPVDYDHSANNDELESSNSIHATNISELPDIHNEDSNIDDIKISNDTLEYPVEVINAQEFTPNEGVKLQDGFNINPEGYVPNQENMEQQSNVTTTITENIDNSGIEAFDAEQKDLFVSEEVEGNYNYEPDPTEVAYNPEYVENQNYEQDQGYQYYEGGDQQENYPVEVNEYEETSQRYDQNYEQQYANNYEQEFAQPEFSAEQPQQYEEPVAVYDQPQAQYDQQAYEQYDYGQQNQETVQQVENVLDNEEGYIQQNVTEETTNSELQPAAEQNIS